MQVDFSFFGFDLVIIHLFVHFILFTVFFHFFILFILGTFQVRRRRFSLFVFWRYVTLLLFCLITTVCALSLVLIIMSSLSASPFCSSSLVLYPLPN